MYQADIASLGLLHRLGFRRCEQPEAGHGNVAGFKLAENADAGSRSTAVLCKVRLDPSHRAGRLLRGHSDPRIFPMLNDARCAGGVHIDDTGRSRCDALSHYGSVSE